MKNKTIVVTTSDHSRITRILSGEMPGKKDIKTNTGNLAGELQRARKVPPEKVGPDVVTMNSEIEIMDIESKMTKRLKLVYPDQADIKSGRVSILAPIGTAILGYKKGDIIEWNVPAGKKRFLIKDIIYQPEANGDFTE